MKDLIFGLSNSVNRPIIQPLRVLMGRLVSELPEPPFSDAPRLTPNSER